MKPVHKELPDNEELMTFGGHLELLRKMLLRMFVAVFVLAGIVFCFKEETFALLLAPKHTDFVTFKLIEEGLHHFGVDFHFEEYNIPLISTELSAQFMAHISASCILALLLASPYILFELFRFVSPALYEREKRYAHLVAAIIYALFVLGMLMSYFVLFPISFRFLATYQVDASVTSTITLDSYISTFALLTFLMGIVFQLPVVAWVLGKVGFLDASLLKEYRAHAFILVMLVAAIITPPDLFSLILVTVPIYGLYEVSILVLNKFGTK